MFAYARFSTVLCLLCFGAAASVSAQSLPAAPVCALAKAPAASFTVRAPFDVVDGRIYVQARVNGRGPFRFAVDTGASGLGRADKSLVSALGLKIHGKSSTSDGVQSATVDTVQLDSVQLGGLSRQGLEVITRDYGSRMKPEAAFHGILGRDFFADGLLILDYPTKTLSFSPALSLPTSGDQILKYERAFRVPVSIGGNRLVGNLDSGANVSLVMPQAMYDQVASAPLKDAGQGTLANTRIATKYGVLDQAVTIGSSRLTGVEVRVAERFPELLVGAHILQRYTVMIDQRTKAVALCD
ncbi:MAG: pepsin/retropepsin-like aspartic protease family protein [Pseudomonadota bacterium]